MSKATHQRIFGPAALGKKGWFRPDQAVVAGGFTYLLLFALCTLAWAYIPA